MKISLACSADVDITTAEKWTADLPEEKRQRISRYRHQEHRVLALTAHRLLTFSLKSEFGIEPSPDDWATGAYGKPHLKNTNGIHFSISHSGNMALCAVHDKPVGADIECIRLVDDSLARRIMSDEEWRVYQNSSEKNSLFFKVWTLKEAYLKFDGKGIGTALDALSIYPEEDSIISNVQGCGFILIDSIDGYQAAVCAEPEVFGSPEWIDIEKLIAF